MSTLATIYYPDLNPVGAPSVIAACTVLFLVSMAMARRVPARLRRIVTACAPPVLLFLAWPMVFMRHQDADDKVAAFLYLVFGFAFATNCFGFLRLGYRLIGWVFTLAHGYLFVRALAPHIVLLCFTTPWVQYHEAVFRVGLIGFLSAWTPALVLLDRRARRRLRQQRGYCWVCNYDLTGNVSGVCPECGTRLEPCST